MRWSAFIFTRTRSREQRWLQIALLAATTVGLLLLLLVPTADLLLSREVIHRFIHSWG